MSESKKVDVDKLVTKFLGKAPSPEITEEIKSVHREEVLHRLSSILDAAFKQTVRPRQRVTSQQRWFTICGYIAQVTARLVRDLEYEKLRADMDDLKRRVAARNVNTPRGPEFPPGNEPAKATSR